MKKPIYKVLSELDYKAQWIRIYDKRANEWLDIYMNTGNEKAFKNHKAEVKRVGDKLKAFNELHDRYLKEGYKFLVYRDKFTAIPYNVTAA